MNLQQLEYIVALDEYRHFGRAAEHCEISQPTLSTMVQKLEEELGARIFDRSRGAISPTDVGRKIIDQAAIVLSQTEKMYQIVINELSSLSGTISIGILPTVAPYLLPLIAPLFSKKLPDLYINFSELQTAECIDALHSRHIDMAIIASNEDDEALQIQPLFYEEFIGYVAEGEPLYNEQVIRTSQVDPSRLWLLDEGHCFRDQLLRFCQLRRSGKTIHSYTRGSLLTFMHMVERGQGMTFIPELSLPTINEEHKHLIRRFALPRPCRMIGLCTYREYGRTHLLDEIGAIIKSAVPQSMLELQSGQHLA